MIPSVRDALIRLSGSDDYGRVMAYIHEVRMSTSEGLTTMDPEDTINIARFQGRVSAIDMVLNLTNEAEDALDKGTNDG